MNKISSKLDFTDDRYGCLFTVMVHLQEIKNSLKVNGMQKSSEKIISLLKVEPALAAREIAQRIGNVLYVDETPLKMKNKNGYAWVLTKNREIASIYHPTREGDFLKTLLNGYKGILVSDFYAAYDSINCTHQKCLIHLIRDMNDDLLKNPFNGEITFVTKSFTNIMQRIVKTIDKFGLKKERLIKYSEDIERFF